MRLPVGMLLLTAVNTLHKVIEDTGAEVSCVHRFEERPHFLCHGLPEYFGAGCSASQSGNQPHEATVQNVNLVVVPDVDVIELKVFRLDVSFRKLSP